MRDPSGQLTVLYYDEKNLLFALEREGSRFYVATDQVGTPRVASDAAGQPVKVLEYDGFGNLISDSDPTFDVPHWLWRRAGRRGHGVGALLAPRLRPGGGAVDGP